MNWVSEAHKSWEWLQWMREVVGEDVDAGGCLPQLIRGMGEWDEAVARDRHSVGDPDRVDSSEYFVYAASMLSRDAKTAIEGALKHAIAWEVDNPMSWPNLDMDEAKGHWEDVLHVVKTVLQAWILLWNDLAEQREQVSGTFPQQLDQWRALADQAAQTVSGMAVAAWAQRN